MDCCTLRVDSNEREETVLHARRPPRAAAPDTEKAFAGGGQEASSQQAVASTSRFLRSQRFKDMMRHAFDSVDVDKSNSLDTNEVYIAVLHLYLKIAGTVKGAVPPERAKIDELFKRFASPADQEHLDYDQFVNFCEYLCSELAGRIVTQAALQMVVAPLLGLLACKAWTHVMEEFAPEFSAHASSCIPVPADVVVTLVVGIAVSQLVPPLMALIDGTVMRKAKDRTS
eukprot:TRINITY_DN80024_c0_g1_i1.p1 TRINITY_DN80024_c0_g1~~TRINITY_DN80024_c0_g1_i1.p1  ORF type:complete len:228 (+),score=58.55 TRINITY_DN80024_c0_g1_i1:87-770(+)